MLLPIQRVDYNHFSGSAGSVGIFWKDLLAQNRMAQVCPSVLAWFPSARF